VGNGDSSEFVVECFWPGVEEEDLSGLDDRAARSAAAVAAAGGTVHYLGSLLFPEDEVVLCMYAGQVRAVREAAEAASISYERIVGTARSPHALAAQGDVSQKNEGA
jgi:hypothetical protein